MKTPDWIRAVALWPLVRRWIFVRSENERLQLEVARVGLALKHWCRTYGADLSGATDHEALDAAFCKWALCRLHERICNLHAQHVATGNEYRPRLGGCGSDPRKSGDAGSTPAAGHFSPNTQGQRRRASDAEEWRRKYHEARKYLRDANRGAQRNAMVAELAHARLTRPNASGQERRPSDSAEDGGAPAGKLTSDELAEVATKISAHLKAIGAAEFVVTKRGSYGHTWPAEVNTETSQPRGQTHE